jgi:hypothetical protein
MPAERCTHQVEIIRVPEWLVDGRPYCDESGDLGEHNGSPVPAIFNLRLEGWRSGFQAEAAPQPTEKLKHFKPAASLDQSTAARYGRRSAGAVPPDSLSQEPPNRENDGRLSYRESEERLQCECSAGFHRQCSSEAIVLSRRDDEIGVKAGEPEHCRPLQKAQAPGIKKDWAVEGTFHEGSEDRDGRGYRQGMPTTAHAGF